MSDGNHVRPHDATKDSSVENGTFPSIAALDYIPFDPADDSQIRTSMQDLSELIHQHVQNHYTVRNFPVRREDLRLELVKCGWNDRTEPSVEKLESLLINPATQLVAIRHMISWVIIQHIDLRNSPETSLLPAHILGPSQAMLTVKRTAGEQEGRISPLQITFLLL
jgi:hypothetical protein